jgi:hypothetical protein
LSVKRWNGRRTWGKAVGWRCVAGGMKCKGYEAALQQGKEEKGNLKEN